MAPPEPTHTEALRWANLALSGRKQHEVRRLASIELRSTDPRTSPWEAAALISVAVLSALTVLGIWLA